MMGTNDVRTRPSAIRQRAARPITSGWPWILGRLQKAAERILHMIGARAPWEVGVCAALLGPLLLLHAGLLGPLDNALMNLGFDAERTLLLDRLFCALLGAFLAAVVTGKRLAGVGGAMLMYTLAYLVPFALQAANPGPSPTGQRQVLVVGAYAGVLLTVLGLGLFSSGVGAATGAATRELAIALARPPIAALRLMWSGRVPGQASAWGGALCALSAIVMVSVLLVSAVGGATGALTYGPTTGIYAAVHSGGRATARPVARVSGDSASAVTAHGTVHRGTYVSPALGGRMRAYQVYLPPSYSVNTGRRYPVVYLLHGSPGNSLDWMVPGQAPLTVDQLVATRRMREVLLVSPDGQGPLYRYSEWANSADGRQRMEDAIVKDLVATIDQRYRTLPDAANRVIAGLSEGGYGAVNIALHHPEVFGAAISESGYFTAQPQSAVFGTGPTALAVRAYNSPQLYIATPEGKRAVGRIQLVICLGTGDGSYYRGGLDFVQSLQQANVGVKVLTVSGGHSWRNWADLFARAIQLVEPLPKHIARVGIER